MIKVYKNIEIVPEQRESLLIGLGYLLGVGAPKNVTDPIADILFPNPVIPAGTTKVETYSYGVEKGRGI